MADYGKTPPQAIDLEEAVLGALLIDKDAYLEVESLLSPEVFYTNPHQLIYGAIQSLKSRNLPVDILTVSSELESNGQLDSAGGKYAISVISSKVSSSAHISYHAHVIYEQYLKRETIRITSEIQKEAYEEGADAFDLISKLNSLSEQLADVSSVNDEIKEFSDCLMNSLTSIENTKQNGGITGVPTGFATLDNITAGWQPGELVVLAARPGMGKSTLMLELVMNAADHGYSVALFSLEMSELQLTKKMQSNKSEIDGEKIKKNLLSGEDWEALTKASDKLSRFKIYIDDNATLNVSKLKSKCRKMKRKGKLGMIVVDYIQLMSGLDGVGKNSIREQEIAYIARSLKNLSKELSVPVIALSQLSREVEKRASKEPMLSDLRESGAVEQDADIVAFIYRPEYYGITETEDGMSTAGLATIIFAKYRDGSPTRTNLRFLPKISKFVEWESEAVPVRSFNEPTEKELPIGADLSIFATTDDDAPF